MGTQSYPRDDCGDESDGCKIVRCKSVISCCDAPPILEPAEKALDDVPSLICTAILRIGFFACS